jgi:hypothetical protein
MYVCVYKTRPSITYIQYQLLKIGPAPRSQLFLLPLSVFDTISEVKVAFNIGVSVFFSNEFEANICHKRQDVWMCVDEMFKKLLNEI